MPPPPPPPSTPAIQGRTLKESSTNQTISNPTPIPIPMPSKLNDNNTSAPIISDSKAKFDLLSSNHSNNLSNNISNNHSNSLSNNLSNSFSNSLSNNPQISNGVASSNPAIKTEITEKAEAVSNNALTLSREKTKKCQLKVSKLQERRRRQQQQQQHHQQQQQQQHHQEFANNNNCNNHVTSPAGCDKRCCPSDTSSQQNGKFKISRQLNEKIKLKRKL